MKTSILCITALLIAILIPGCGSSNDDTTKLKNDLGVTKTALVEQQERADRAEQQALRLERQNVELDHKSGNLAMIGAVAVIGFGGLLATLVVLALLGFRLYQTGESRLNGAIAFVKKHILSAQIPAAKKSEGQTGTMQPQS